MPASANPLNIEGISNPRAEFQAFVNDYWAEIALCLGVVEHNHDSRYYTESEIDSMLSGKSNTGHTHTTSEITNLSTYTGFDSRFAPAVHNHNTDYYTKSEIDTALAGLGGGDTVIYKSTNEPRDSTTTLTLDTDLQFEADAHDVYELDLRIVTHCNGGGGMLAYKIELPSAVSGVDRFMVTGNYNNASSVSYAAPSSDDSQFGYVYVTLYASQPVTLHLRTNVIIGGTGGTVGFKWAQATSNATATEILKGSTLKYRKLN